MHPRPSFRSALLCALFALTSPLAARAANVPNETNGLTLSGWTVEGNVNFRRYGASTVTAGDVNGDGYSDFLVTRSGSTSGTGTADLYYGTATGPALTPGWTRTGWTQEPHAAPAGDVNHDGYDDFIVGWGSLFASGGQVSVYYGGPGGPGATPFTLNTGTGSGLGYSFGPAGDVNGDGYDDIVVGDPTATCTGTSSGTFGLYYGAAGGLTAGNSALYCGFFCGVGAQFGFSVHGAGDVNGDGYADVVVGAPNYNGGSGAIGRLCVYFGSAGGLGGTFQIPPVIINGFQTGARFGACVSTAGDFNGDGYADVAVGAPNMGGSGFFEFGSAWAYWGGPSGPSTGNLVWLCDGGSTFAHNGAILGPAGDVNGDGYADVAVGAPDYDGPSTTDQGGVTVVLGRSGTAPFPTQLTFYGNAANEHFGTGVGAAGDVNGDGFGDLVIGCPGWSNGNTEEGRALLYFGSANKPQTTSAWGPSGSQFAENIGWSVAAAGDVNGDGFADVIYGAPFRDEVFGDDGRATLYLGSASGLGAAAWSRPGDDWSAAFGFSVAGAGDVNGDGYEDWIVGAPYGASGGAARVFAGGPGVLSNTPIWTAIGAPGALFGSYVAGAGDVNGDGYSDVLVGSPLDPTGGSGAGRAFLYLGGPTGPHLSPDRIFTGSQADEHLGDRVAGIGDVNGDGFSDIAIAAPLFDNQTTPFITITDAGRVLVYYGTDTGVALTPSLVIAARSQQYLGYGLAGAGDVNGDGYSDLIVGGPYYSSSAPLHAGVANVYLGGAGGLAGLAAWSIVGAAAEDQLGWSVGSAGDVNGDGASDIVVGSYLMGASDQGGARVYAGFGSTTPFWSRDGANGGDWFGFSTAGAGDVNGDGFGDVIVGAPAYNAFDGGLAQLFLGNVENGFNGLDRRFLIRLTDGTTPIAPLGLSGEADYFWLGNVGRSAAGPNKIFLNVAVNAIGGGVNAAGMLGSVTAWGPGSTPMLGGPTGGYTPGARYAVRGRVESNSPFFPTTPWFTPVLGGRAVMDFRMRHEVNGVGDGLVASSLALANPSPNPSSGAVVLDFALPLAADARLTIHDVAGREIARLADGRFGAGVHAARWNGREAGGREASPGVYFARLLSRGESVTKRIVRVR